MKALVIFSGGIDSTVTLALAIKKYGNKNTYAIGFDYGQKNRKELKNAKKISQYYNIEYNIINIKNIFSYSNSSMLKTSNIEIPKICYDEQVKNLKENENVTTNVPFRNGVFLSIATSIALSKNAEVIYYGIHKEEGIAYSLYPDCSSEFNKDINNAISNGTGKRVKVEAPLVNLLKKDVIKLGIKLKIPFDLTWTCYESNSKPCHKCTACTDREKAFIDNNMLDPGVE